MRHHPDLVTSSDARARARPQASLPSTRAGRARCRRSAWALVSLCMLACRPSLFDDLSKETEQVETDAQTLDDAAVADAETGPADADEQPPATGEPQAMPDAAQAGGEPDATPVQPSVPEAGAPPEAAIDAGSDAQEASVLPEASIEPDPPAMCLGSGNPDVCGCNRDCRAFRATGTCVNGHCTRKCQTTDFEDCDGDLARGTGGNGCETDLRTNDASCNGCNQHCLAEHVRFVGCEERMCRTLELPVRQLRVFDRCLDVEGPYLGNHVPLQIWTCGDHFPQQEWAENHGELRGWDNRCVDVRGPVSENGTAIQMYDCVRAPQQTWTLNDKGQLVGFTGKCLQVKDGIDADGQDVELSDCQDIPAQHWRWVDP